MVLIHAEGKSLTISEWSVLNGINSRTLYNRLFVLGWSDTDTVCTPVKKQYLRNRSLR